MAELLKTQPGDHVALNDGAVKTGAFAFGVNEVNLRSLIDDPPKYTLESSSGALGGWSARYVLPNGSPVELALVQFKKDERTRGRHDVLWGEWTVHLKGPATESNPDGMVLVFLALHDYVWMVGQPGPVVPPVSLPPVTEPPPDDWTSPENVATHIEELDDIAAEFESIGGPEFVPDEKTRAAYISGRNRDLKEIHDDMMSRADGEHVPEMHPDGAPY